MKEKISIILSTGIIIIMIAGIYIIHNDNKRIIKQNNMIIETGLNIQLIKEEENRNNITGFYNSIDQRKQYIQNIYEP